MNRSKLEWAGVVVFLSALVTASGFFAYRPGWVQLVQVPLLLCFLMMAVCSFVGIFVLWPRRKWRALVPFGISLLCVPLLVLSVMVGGRVRLYVFEKRLAEYQQAVGMMGERVEAEPVVLWGADIPEGYRHLGYCIRGEKDEQDVVIVTFFWGSAFPARHTGFAYISDGKLPEQGSDFRRAWRGLSRINENWFEVAD
ncbi:MAG: hypothetical protein ACYTEL_08640 [Planctomycetota bacterium]|jgi:hypothetical protein